MEFDIFFSFSLGNARRIGGFASAGRQLLVDGFEEDEAIHVSLQFLLLFRAEADATDVAFAVRKRIDNPREVPLVPRRVFGDKNDIADDDIATVAGPFPALL